MRFVKIMQLTMRLNVIVSKGAITIGYDMMQKIVGSNIFDVRHDTVYDKKYADNRYKPARLSNSNTFSSGMNSRSPPNIPANSQYEFMKNRYPPTSPIPDSVFASGIVIIIMIIMIIIIIFEKIIVVVAAIK